MQLLHAETEDNSGFFGNAWSQAFVDVWNSECECQLKPVQCLWSTVVHAFMLPCALQSETDSMVSRLRQTDLATSFRTPGEKNVGGIASQLKLIAKLIAIRNERGKGINRDVFYCEMGGAWPHTQSLCFFCFAT